MDLILHFDVQELMYSLGDVNDREEIVLELQGMLLEEYGAMPIIGEDVVVILEKGKSK